MRRKTSILAIGTGGLFVLVWTVGLTQRAGGQEKPLWFPCNGKACFLLGANYPWYNGHRGLDLGPYLGSKTIATVSFASPRNSGAGHDVQFPSIPIRPGTTGFNADGIEAQLQDMQAIGIHMLRWFFGYDGRSFMIFDQHNYCTGHRFNGLAKCRSGSGFGRNPPSLSGPRPSRLQIHFRRPLA